MGKSVNRSKNGFLFCLMSVFLLIFSSCSSFPPQSEQPPQPNAENQSTVSDTRQWRSATYRGLEVGKSTRKDMMRVLGKPISIISEAARITTNPNAFTGFYYGGPDNLIIRVEKVSHIIAWIETSPKNLLRDNVIKQFGGNYSLTGYSVDPCFIDGQPRMLYEASVEEAITSTNVQHVQMEYRQLSVTVQFRSEQEVYRIIYVSGKWPFGNAYSLCDQPKKHLAYTACGCGCCGGTQPKKQCIFQSKGDDLKAMVQKDIESGRNTQCDRVGCGSGIKYVYCD